MGHDSVGKLFANLDPSVWLLTAADGPRRGGLIATTVVQASIVPELPRVLVAVARQHFTWELVEASGAFALHLLDEDRIDLVERFGLRSGRDFDKLAGLDFHDGTTGSPILTDTPGWLECRVENRMPTGDRTVYLAEVIDGELRRETVPLTMQRLLALAPPEMLRELKSQLARDAAVDAELIRAWRP